MGKPDRLERLHMQAVAQLPCACRGCNHPCEQLHHVRGLEFGTGMGLKASHYLVLPTCANHHHEFHTLGRKTWEARYGTQAEMIEWVKGVLAMSRYEHAVLGF